MKIEQSLINKIIFILISILAITIWVQAEITKACVRVIYKNVITKGEPMEK